MHTNPHLSSETDSATTLYERFKALSVQQGASIALLASRFPALNFADLMIEIDRIGTLLHEAGLGRGDRIALAAPSGPETACAILGIAANAVCIPFHPGLTGEECLSLLQATKAKALLILNGDSGAIPDSAARLKFTIVDGNRPLGSSAAPLTISRPLPDDPALLMVTSGTTDRPKIVPVTHRQLLARGRKTQILLGLTSNDRCLNLMPLCYTHGLNSGLLGPILAGGSSICQRVFDRQSFIEGLHELAATWYTSGATHQNLILSWILQAPGEFSDHRLRFARSGSSPLPAYVQQELENRLGIPIIESYSSTETGTITANPPSGPRKSGTVGRGIAGELAIMDAAGIHLPAGQPGEVLVKGPCVITAYENDPEANRLAFRDEWFRTGDLGVLDGDGNLTLTGRIKEIINRGGEKIAPAEVDAALLRHPAIAEAITFPVPHATLHEDIAAAVVLFPGQTPAEADLISFLLLSLTPFKIPRRILQVEAIPKGPTGKPVRNRLAEYFAKDLAPNPSKKEDQPSPILRVLTELWRKVFRLDAAGPDDNFFIMGGDSLSAINLLASIETTLQINIAIDELVPHPTPRLLAQAIEAENIGKTQNIFSFHTDGRQTPLFAFGGRNGYVVCLVPIAYELGHDQPLYALQPPDMDWEQAGCLDLSAMAAHYIRRIRDIQPSGPYRLLGTSFGGLMALEVARRLQQHGETVEMLAVLDSAPPNYRLAKRCATFRPATLSINEVPASATKSASLRIAQAHVRARETYVLDHPFEGEIVYFFCMGVAGTPGYDPRRHWRHFATAGARFIALPGRHGSFHKEPQFSAFCDALKACLNNNLPAGVAPTALFAPYRLSYGGKDALIHGPGKTQIPVIGKAPGQLDEVYFSNHHLLLTGWAVDPMSSQTVNTLLFFLNGHYLGRGGCGIPMVDTGETNPNPRLSASGYRLVFPLPDKFVHGENDKIQIYILAPDLSVAWGIGH